MTLPPDPDNLVEATIDRAADKVAGAAISRPTFIGLYTLGIVTVLLIGALFVIRALDQQTIRQSQNLIRQGVSCLLADLDDHRHTNQFAHNKLAEHDNVMIDQPDVIPLTRDQALVLKRNCDEFIHAQGLAARK